MNLCITCTIEDISQHSVRELLTDTVKLTPETDPIRKNFRLFGNHFFIACIIFYSAGVITLFYTNPKHVVFLYGCFDLQSYSLAWIPFLGLELLVMLFYIGMLAFYASLFVIISYTIHYGGQQLCWYVCASIYNVIYISGIYRLI